MKNTKHAFIINADFTEIQCIECEYIQHTPSGQTLIHGKINQGYDELIAVIPENLKVEIKTKTESSHTDILDEYLNKLSHAGHIIDAYLNAGSKEDREHIAEHAKKVYKEIFGIEYKNINERV